MKQTIIALAAAALVAAALPSSAQARCHGCGVGAGVVGGRRRRRHHRRAIANSQPRYVEPAPVYARRRPAVYVEPPDYVDGPVCHIERQQVWDGYGYRTAASRSATNPRPTRSARCHGRACPGHLVEGRIVPT